MGSSRRVGALPGPSDGARWLRRGASAVGSAALVVAAAAASHYGGEFSDMPALGLGAPVPSVIAKLGRRNDRVLLAPMQHLAYCNLPKAASSTVTTYMTGLNVDIHKFSDVEKFIVERGGDSHFAMVRYSTFHEAGLEHWRNSSAPPYRYFTVVRHPGENHAHTFPIVPPDPPEPSPVTDRDVHHDPAPHPRFGRQARGCTARGSIRSTRTGAPTSPTSSTRRATTTRAAHSRIS